MAPGRPSLGEVVVKTIVTHTVTYFLIGLAAFWSFDYARMFAEPGVRSFMRQTDEPLVMAGPLFQPIRGLLFGLVFYLLREPLFGARAGWLVLWLVLVAVGILGTFGPAPGSLEGMVFTTLPLRFHLESLPEIVVQSLALAALLWYWMNHPAKRWLTWGLGVAFVVVLLLPALGLLASRATAPSGGKRSARFARGVRSDFEGDQKTTSRSRSSDCWLAKRRCGTRWLASSMNRNRAEPTATADGGRDTGFPEPMSQRGAVAECSRPAA